MVLFPLSIHILCNESQPVPDLCQVFIFSFFLIKKKDEDANEDAILVLFLWRKEVPEVPGILVNTYFKDAHYIHSVYNFVFWDSSAKETIKILNKRKLSKLKLDEDGIQ